MYTVFFILVSIVYVYRANCRLCVAYLHVYMSVFEHQQRKLVLRFNQTLTPL